MPGSTTPSRSPGDPAFDAEPPPLSAFFDRPEPTGSWRERAADLLARGPVRPARLIAVAFGAVVVIAVLVWLLRPAPAPIETSLPRATEASGEATADAPTTSVPPTTALRALVVDAAGAVARPGLYRLSPGARVDDLVQRAGGLRAGADPDRLNLAAPLADGQRLYVPKVGELVTPAPVDPVGGSDPAGSASPTTGPGGASGAVGPSAAAPVDLNTATAEQLDALPGVGPATAASILEYRTQHGRFRSVDELLEVRGIGDAKLGALRTKVRV